MAKGAGFRRQPSRAGCTAGFGSGVPRPSDPDLAAGLPAIAFFSAEPMLRSS